MGDCVIQPCADIAALRAQVRCLTRQIENLTREVGVLTERQHEANELEHIIRRARFAPYVDGLHHVDGHEAGLPRRHLRLVR